MDLDHLPSPRGDIDAAADPSFGQQVKLTNRIALRPDHLVTPQMQAVDGQSFDESDFIGIERHELVESVKREFTHTPRRISIRHGSAMAPFGSARQCSRITASSESSKQCPYATTGLLLVGC
jgi:hypothetical protein